MRLKGKVLFWTTPPAKFIWSLLDSSNSLKKWRSLKTERLKSRRLGIKYKSFVHQHVHHGKNFLSNTKLTHQQFGNSGGWAQLSTWPTTLDTGTDKMTNFDTNDSYFTPWPPYFYPPYRHRHTQVRTLDMYESIPRPNTTSFWTSICLFPCIGLKVLQPSKAV